MSEIKAMAYQEIPSNKLQGKSLSNWSRADIWVLLISCAAIIAAWAWLDPILVLLLGSVAVALNFRFASGYGRNYDEMIAAFRGWYITSVLKGVLWNANSKEKGLIPFLRRKGWFLGRRRPIPLSFARVEAVIDGQLERYSLLRQLDRPYDHLYIAARGGAFAGMDINRQQHAVDTLADLTNEVIAQSDLKVGFSYVRINGPYDPTKVVGYLRSNMNPFIAQPEQFELDTETLAWTERMRRNANQLRPVAARFGAAETWYLIILTIKRGKEWNQARRGKLSSKQLYELPIVELGRSMVDSLSSSAVLELDNVHCLNLAELASVVRCSWDITGIQDYYQQRAEHQIPQTDEDIDAWRKEVGDEKMGEVLHAWPEKCIEVSRDGSYVRFDDNYIATLRVNRLPERVRADQFLDLHYTRTTPKSKPPGWTRQAMVGQSVSGDAETRQFILGESALINWNSAIRGHRIVPDPRYLRKRRALSNQANQVSAHSVSQHFNMLHTVVADSPTALRLQVKRLRASLLANNFHAEQVTPPARLIDAVISGALGINRL